MALRHRQTEYPIEAALRRPSRPLLIWWTAPLQRHRDVPILSNDSLKTDSILAFAERQLLAINGH